MTDGKNKSEPLEEVMNLMKDKNFKKNLNQIENMIGQANLNLYGTDRMSDVDRLNGTFQSLLNNEIGVLTNKNSEDVTSFLSKLYSNDKKTNAIEDLVDNQFMSMTGDDYQAMQGFLFEAYRNRLLEQSDLHEVASQLIELSEAILITRDAIISADVVEGRMSRTISFDKIDEDEINNAIPIVESVEKRFDILNKIKNFIIPKTLEYGEYYVYTIPYSKIFNDFMRHKNLDGRAGNMYPGNNLYHESTVFENVMSESSDEMSSKKSTKKSKVESSAFVEELFNEYVDSYSTDDEKKSIKDKKDEFVEDVNNMMKNISICNDSVPLPVIEEGVSSINQYMTEYVNESGTTFTEAKDKDTKDQNFFKKIINGTDNGVTITNDNTNKSSKGKKKKGEFDDITDCYIKLIDPTKVIPIKIMNQIIGYYYIQAEDITPLSGMISSTLYYSKFDENARQQTVVDSIAERIVNCFDKQFLKDNLKFKETIVEAINYYNLNEKRLKFQFIPVEYMAVFKIDQDENGDGQSMIKKSLFYAKLYLMILLFKIMSIILNSNDQKVNYIKTSGISKDLANKVQEIARIKQSRQINMYDLFNYTTLINKVGNGTEQYIPVGRSGERPIETEILSGQDVPLNGELLEMLKNGYILATGVPAAIINYLNEADFAKVIEQNNTKFNGRVVNYQLDFNPSITEWYKMILRWSTNIPVNMIENFEFTLQPPKTVASSAKSESINNFNAIVEFVVGLMYDDPNQNQEDIDLPRKIKTFKKLFAKEQLPMLNIDKIEELVKEANLMVKEETFKPDPMNGDNNDDGLDFDMDDNSQQ